MSNSNNDHQMLSMHQDDHPQGLSRLSHPKHIHNRYTRQNKNVTNTVHSKIESNNKQQRWQKKRRRARKSKFNQNTSNQIANETVSITDKNNKEISITTHRNYNELDESKETIYVDWDENLPNMQQQHQKSNYRMSYNNNNNNNKNNNNNNQNPQQIDNDLEMESKDPIQYFFKENETAIGQLSESHAYLKRKHNEMMQDSKIYNNIAAMGVKTEEKNKYGRPFKKRRIEFKNDPTKQLNVSMNRHYQELKLQNENLIERKDELDQKLIEFETIILKPNEENEAFINKLHDYSKVMSENFRFNSIDNSMEFKKGFDLSDIYYDPATKGWMDPTMNNYKTKRHVINIARASRMNDSERTQIIIKNIDKQITNKLELIKIWDKMRENYELDIENKQKYNEENNINQDVSNCWLDLSIKDIYKFHNHKFDTDNNYYNNWFNKRKQRDDTFANKMNLMAQNGDSNMYPNLELRDCPITGLSVSLFIHDDGPFIEKHGIYWYKKLIDDFSKCNPFGINCFIEIKRNIETTTCWIKASPAEFPNKKAIYGLIEYCNNKCDKPLDLSKLISYERTHRTYKNRVYLTFEGEMPESLPTEWKYCLFETPIIWLTERLSDFEKVMNLIPQCDHCLYHNHDTNKEKCWLVKKCRKIYKDNINKMDCSEEKKKELLLNKDYCTFACTYCGSDFHDETRCPLAKQGKLPYCNKCHISGHTSGRSFDCKCLQLKALPVYSAYDYFKKIRSNSSPAPNKPKTMVEYIQAPKAKEWIFNTELSDIRNNIRYNHLIPEIDDFEGKLLNWKKQNLAYKQVKMHLQNWKNLDLNNKKELIQSMEYLSDELNINMVEFNKEHFFKNKNKNKKKEESTVETEMLLDNESMESDDNIGNNSNNNNNNVPLPQPQQPQQQPSQPNNQQQPSQINKTHKQQHPQQQPSQSNNTNKQQQPSQSQQFDTAPQQPLNSNESQAEFDKIKRNKLKNRTNISGRDFRKEMTKSRAKQATNVRSIITKTNIQTGVTESKSGLKFFGINTGITNPWSKPDAKSKLRDKQGDLSMNQTDSMLPTDTNDNDGNTVVSNDTHS